MKMFRFKMAGWGKELVNYLKRERGYRQIGDVLYPREQLTGMTIPQPVNRKTKGNKTGWTDDFRNIKNKQQQDAFIFFLKQQLNVEVWPEFYFHTSKNYRIDYAIPISCELKIAIEIDGGIWKKGNSGHSSGKGILRDMNKTNLLSASGWKIIRITPDKQFSIDVLDAIKTYINTIKLN